jgi:hypothetical protein
MASLNIASARELCSGSSKFNHLLDELWHALAIRELGRDEPERCCKEARTVGQFRARGLEDLEGGHIREAARIDDDLEEDLPRERGLLVPRKAGGDVSGDGDLKLEVRRRAGGRAERRTGALLGDGTTRLGARDEREEESEARPGPRRSHRRVAS